MTAEIVVFNKNGIALAADSAVAVSISKDQAKVYNTANKLFALSKHQPIGIMVYGSAEVMGMPWEVVVKQYRRSLKTDSFDRLDQYVDHFFDYLCNKAFSEETYHSYVYNQSLVFMLSVFNAVDNDVKAIIDKKGEVSDDEIRDAHATQVDANYRMMLSVLKQNRTTLKSVKPNMSKYNSHITDLFNNICGARPIQPGHRKKLIDAAILFSILGPSLSRSGVVIAGFGSKEVFPHVRAFEIHKILDGKITHEEVYSEKISHDMQAAIRAFAQAGETAAFMNGLSQRFVDFCIDDMAKTFSDEFGDKIAEALLSDKYIHEEDKSEIAKKITSVGKAIHDSLKSELQTIVQREFNSPVVDTVKFFSPTEMANMAETFVNLESFRKQVTLSSETVGGPIDIAVITKGDGFIWIKRKHYFQPELNHQFFHNYNLREG